MQAERNFLNYEEYRLPDFVEYKRVNNDSYLFKTAYSNFIQVKISPIPGSQCFKKYKSKQTYNVYKYHFELNGYLVNFTCFCINGRYFICDVWLTYRNYNESYM